MEIRLPDLRTGYRELVRTVRETGSPVTVRGRRTRELTGVTLRFADLTQPMLPVRCGRGVNVRLAAVEALQLVAGVSVPELITRASPRYVDVLVDPEDPDYGAYGPRTRVQLEAIVELLRVDPTSRQAVARIWRGRDLIHVGDKPCTLTLQFLLRDDGLQLHTTMRSQDVWLGVPYDVFMFTQLQLTVAHTLAVDVGPYVHHVASLHLYERDVAASHRLVDPAPLAEHLPLGVVPMLGSSRGATLGYARRLLANGPDGIPNTWCDLNPWYVRQLAPLHEPSEVTP